MDLQLNTMITQEIEYFIKIFLENGWEREDSELIAKNADFIANPDYKHNKYKICLCIFPEILYYGEKNEESIKIWIAFRFETHKDSSKYLKSGKRLNKIADWLKNELKNMNLNAFRDQDAFNNIFSNPDVKKEYVSFSFYLNKDYPKGYWSNHTL